MYHPIEQPQSPEEAIVCTCEMCENEVDEHEDICYHCRADAICAYDEDR